MGKLQITPSRALLVNSLLLLFPILYFAALLPFAIKSCLTYRSLLDIFASLDQQLQEGVATFDPSSFSLIALAPGLAGLNSLSSLMEILIWDVRRVFIVFTVSGVVIVLVSVSRLLRPRFGADPPSRRSSSSCHSFTCGPSRKSSTKPPPL